MIDPLYRFYDNAKQNYSQEGINGIKKTLDLSVGIAKETVLDHTTRRLTRLDSENVFTRQWDVLILLDCARVDMMREVADEYDFINDVSRLKSVSGHSRGWMEYTFVEEFHDEIQNTLYVNANTASDRVLDPNDFLHLEEVWRDGWDNEHKTILAETVTDRAISLYRRYNPERTIVHYMQPHSPFVPFPEVISGQVTGPDIEKDCRKSLEELAEEYSREDIWEFHMENLRYVLDSVQTVLSNIEAERVIISSDHGQALGEENVWGHPRGTAVESVRQVPWVVTSASDTGDYEPNYDINNLNQKNGENLSVDEKLEYLGYKP